jgi:hypothetical protein
MNTIPFQRSTPESHPDVTKLEPIHVIDLNPSLDIGTGWIFKQGAANGPKDNDGISGFLELLARLSSLPVKEAKKLLFADGLATIRTQMPGKDRILELASRKLADPGLLIALCRQRDQSILHYLHKVYGVKLFEALRRTICNSNGEQECSLTVRLSDDGSLWEWRPYLLKGMRGHNLQALILGA